MNVLGSRKFWRPVVLSATISASLSLAACGVTGTSGSSGAQGNGEGTINILVMKQASYSESDVAKMVAEFAKQNPHIKVNTTFEAYEALHDKIVAAAPSGTYDIVETDVDLPELASKGFIADVSSKYPSSWQTEMVGGAIQAAAYNGKYYGVPWGPSTKLFFYNKDMLAKVGATSADLQTWDGVLAVAKRIKAAGLVKYPFAWSWAQAEAVICDYGQLLGAFGGTFTDAGGKLVVNQTPGVQALTWMKQTLDEGLTDPASPTFLEDDTNKSMASGKTAFELNWESTFRDLNDPSISQVVGKVGVMPTPTGQGGQNPSINGAEVLSISSKSTNQAAAWAFVQFLTSEAVQDEFATSSMTNWKQSYTDPKITASNPDVFAAAGKAYDNMIIRPQVPAYHEASQILQVEIQNALLGRKTPQQALDDAVAATNAKS